MTNTTRHIPAADPDWFETVQVKFDGNTFLGSPPQYPNIAWWVADGRIEIGRDEYSDPLIRVLDQGGLVWESDKEYETIAEALTEAEAAIGCWVDEHGH